MGMGARYGQSVSRMMRSAGMSAITARTSSAALKVAIPETENQAPSAAARRASSAPEV